MRYTLDQVVQWYDHKTDSIIEKFGAGQRIHFHSGYVPEGARLAGDLPGLRWQLHTSQEEMFRVAAWTWQAHAALKDARLLDVGAGLGGGSLYWAKEFGAHVTAVTPVERHAHLIQRFAREAGLSERVSTAVTHAEQLRHLGRFDAVVACESATYFNRERWFLELAAVLPSGGHVFIEDTFCTQEELLEPFNSYWLTDIARVEDYCQAAQKAGFDVAYQLDVTQRTARFWEMSLAYIDLRLKEGGSQEELARLRRSYEVHQALHEGYLTAGYQYYLLDFVRR